MLLVATLLHAESPSPATRFVARWGGTGKDLPSALVMDAGRHLFVVGHTFAADFPTTAGPRSTGTGCGFTTRLSASSGAHEYSTTLCTRGITYARAAAVTPDGGIWVTGATDGIGLPVTPNAIQRHYAGYADLRSWGDAIIARQSTDDGAIRYASYLGGAGDEVGEALIADDQGGVWIGGSTTSRNFPLTAGALQPKPSGGWDAFLARVDSHGALAFATYFGGAGHDTIAAMSPLDAGRIVVAGSTDSPNAPFGQRNYGGVDGFVAVFDRTTRSLVWVRRLGGRGNDRLHAVTVLPGGLIVAAGESDSPTCARGRDGDGWIAAVSATGQVQGEHCIGGAGRDVIQGIAAVDRSIWVTGVTESSDFPLTVRGAGTRASGSSRQAFVARVEPRRGAIAFATLLGSNGTPRNVLSEGRAISVAGPDIFVAGDVAPQYGGAVPTAGGQILPTREAFGYGREFASHDTFVISLLR